MSLVDDRVDLSPEGAGRGGIVELQLAASSIIASIFGSQNPAEAADGE